MRVRLQDTTLIVRECGERTKDVACKLLSELADNEGVIRIEERPFTQAVRKSFQVGLERGRKWTFCLDADVLCTDTGIVELVETANRQGDDVFELQGMVADHLFGIQRPAGNHLYRTALLKKALGRIPHPETSLRPEHDTILAMREMGYVDIQLPTFVGIHDFEQSYVDIYRKCFLQSRKHGWLENLLLERWDALGEAGSCEFKIASAGYRDGRDQKGPVIVSQGFHEDRVGKLLQELGVPAQGALNTAEYDTRTVLEEATRLMSEVSTEGVRQQAAQLNYYFAKPISATKRREYESRKVRGKLRALCKQVIMACTCSIKRKKGASRSG